MDVIVINGEKALSGTVATSGSKNAALPLLFASLLAEGEHQFDNVPCLKDIDSTELLLNHLNCKTTRTGNRMSVTVTAPEKLVAPYDIVRKMRASILCLGPLLARYGKAKVSLPGGCAIGSRPINLHIEPLQQLGAQIEIENGYVIAKAKKLVGDRIVLDFRYRKYHDGCHALPGDHGTGKRRQGARDCGSCQLPTWHGCKD